MGCSRKQGENRDRQTVSRAVFKKGSTSCCNFLSHRPLYSPEPGAEIFRFQRHTAFLRSHPEHRDANGVIPHPPRRMVRDCWGKLYSENRTFFTGHSVSFGTVNSIGVSRKY